MAPRYVPRTSSALPAAAVSISQSVDVEAGDVDVNAVVIVFRRAEGKSARRCLQFRIAASNPAHAIVVKRRSRRKLRLIIDRQHHAVPTPTAFVALITISAAPPAAGVPLITPVPEFKVHPVGKPTAP